MLVFCIRLEDLYRCNCKCFCFYCFIFLRISTNTPPPGLVYDNHFSEVSDRLFDSLCSHFFSLSRSLCHKACPQSPRVLCSDPANYFYPALRRRWLSGGYYIVSQSGWSGLTLCISGIMTENRCDGGRQWWWWWWGGSLLLSWRPLQNNWMAYQVAPQSLIACFSPDRLK